MLERIKAFRVVNANSNMRDRSDEGKEYAIINDLFAGCDTKDIEINVARGALVLDALVPNWAEKVQGSIIEGMFEMQDWHRCMVGTLEMMRVGEDGRRVVAFNGVAIATTQDSEWGQSYEAFAALGFIQPPRDPNNPDPDYFQTWDRLQQLWEQEVEKRTDDN